MKQCKVCGTLVHIDSNTCPSCGNHSFFVLDVKICPLCGKVNNITSSFCEQCGKQFVTAQGVSFVKKPLPPQRPAASIYRERPAAPVQRQEEIEKSQQIKAENADYEIEKPVIKSPKPLITEENAAERAYKDFMALKPEVLEKEDYSEFSYYVKGDANKLPVIILPKFAKTSGKNIIVNIVVNSEQPAQQIKNIAETTQQQIVQPKAADIVPANVNINAAPSAPAVQEEKITPSATAQKDEPLNEQGLGKDILTEAAEPVIDIPEDEKFGEFKPFSAIEENAPVDIYKDAEKEKQEGFSNADIAFKDLKQNAAETVKEDSSKKQKKVKEVKPKVIKEKKVKKEKVHYPITAGSVFSSIILILLALGILSTFTMAFYTSQSGAYNTSGLSPVLYLIKNLTGIVITPFFPHFNGYEAYLAANTTGQFAHLAVYVPYLFTLSLIFILFALFVHIFTFRHRKWARITLSVTGIITLLFEIGIALAIKYVFNSGVINTLGLGLILALILTFIYYVTMIFAYRTNREE